MAQFNYNLQNILDLKEKIEEQRKLKFTKVNNQFITETAKLNQIHIKKNTYEQTLKANVKGELKAYQIRRLYGDMERIKNIYNNQAKIVVTAEKNMEQARTEMKSAMVERKTYETLKEKAYTQFKIEENKKEQVMFDEINNFKFFKSY